MFVLNPCHNDARVRKEAASLGAAGFDVRIFALGNSQWPEELVVEDGFTIQRLEVVSIYQRWLGNLTLTYRWLIARNAAVEVAERPPRPPLPLALLFAPIAPLVWILREVASRARSRLRARDNDDAARRVGRVTERTGRRAARKMKCAARRAARKMKRAARRAARMTERTTRRAARMTYLCLHKLLRRVLLRLHRPSVFLQYWRKGADAAVAWRPDVVHGHDLNALPAAARAARVTGARLVYDSHELWRRRNRGGQLRPLARLVDAYQERRLIRRADLVITVSGSISRWLQHAYRLPAAPMVLRNLPTRLEPRAGPSLRALAGLEEERILLYTGRITSGRGIEDAIAALPLLPRDVVLVMLGYGDADYLDFIAARVTAHGVADRVRHVPAVAPNEVSAVATQATMALVAIEPLCLSYRYSLPNKLFEAIQGGVPVLATDLPDIADLVKRYRCGELFPPDDPAAFRAAARKILADPIGYRAAATKAGGELHWAMESGLLVAAYQGLGPTVAEGTSALISRIGMPPESWT